MASSGIGIDDESMIETISTPKTPSGFSAASSQVLALTSPTPIFLQGTAASIVTAAPRNRNRNRNCSVHPAARTFYEPYSQPTGPKHAAAAAESPRANSSPPPGSPANSLSTSLP